jgi:hypothetical protein
MASSAGPNEVERLLAAAAADPAERPAFAPALLDADVLALGSLDRDPVGGRAEAGTGSRLVSWEDDDGETTPFFTSEPMLHATLAARPDTDPHFVTMRCRDLWEITRGARFVLNPHGPHGKVFLAAETDAYLSGQEPGFSTETLAAAREVLVGQPAHLPPNLPEVLTRFLVQRPVVEAAHLGWIAYPDGRSGFLMVVVATDREEALAGFGSVAVGELTEGATFDVMVVSPSEEHHALSSVPPFYVRRPPPDASTAKKSEPFLAVVTHAFGHLRYD